MVKNKIFNQDVCTFLKKQKNNSADLIIADPPYNIKIDKWDIFESNEKYWEFMKKWLKIAIKKLKKGGSIYIFNNQYNSALTLEFLKNKLHFNNWITWYKKDGFHPTKNKFVSNQETCLFMSKEKPKTFNFDQIRVPYISIKRLTSGKGVKGKNGKYWKPNTKGKLCSDVWEISSERHIKKINGKTTKMFHPTIKPSKLIERIIIASSNKNDFVLDLFSGSGQTSKICKKLERNSEACEIEKEYFKKIKKELYDK